MHKISTCWPACRALYSGKHGYIKNNTHADNHGDECVRGKSLRSPLNFCAACRKVSEAKHGREGQGEGQQTGGEPVASRRRTPATHTLFHHALLSSPVTIPCPSHHAFSSASSNPSCCREPACPPHFPASTSDLFTPSSTFSRTHCLIPLNVFYSFLWPLHIVTLVQNTLKGLK